MSDITKKKASEEIIWRQANFDTLTSLPNRRMFHEHLRKEMKKTDRSQLPMALVFVDLDYFKEINDTLGHDKGDLLLKEVASRLLSCMRSTVARLGGDEFTVILGELRNAGDVMRIAQDILKKMSTPFHLGENIAVTTGRFWRRLRADFPQTLRSGLPQDQSGRRIADL